MPCLYAVCCQITSRSLTRVNGWTLTGIWSFLRPCLQAGRFPFKRVKDTRLITSEMFQVGLSCYLGLNSGRWVSISVNKTRKHFSRNIYDARMFPNVFQFPIKHCFQCHFLFSRCKLCLRYTAGNFNENVTEHASTCKNFASTSKRALIQFLRAVRVKAKFCEHFQIGWDHSIPLKDKSKKQLGSC